MKLMKKFFVFFVFVCITTNMQAQINTISNKKSIVDNIISGMTYPNISKDTEDNFYLVNSTECKAENLQVLKLGKKEDALNTLGFFKSFIKDEEAGAFIDIEDESNGYKYRVFRVNQLGQGGLKFESLDNHYNCSSVIFIKSINKAIELVESSK